MKYVESRRTFLKHSSLLLSGAALVGLAGCSSAPASSAAASSTAASAAPVDAEPEVPAYPYEACEFDVERVKELGYEAFGEGGCCYGAAKALLTELQDKVGYPYTVIPAEMFSAGKAGYGAGSLCGSLGGSIAVMGLLVGPEDLGDLVAQLRSWYTSTELPIYQPEGEPPVHTVADSVDCNDSVTKFMNAAGISEMSDPVRLARCAGVTADVAAKAAELLNVYFGYAEAPADSSSAAASEPELADNEYIGEAQGMNGTVKVKVTMDGDKISKIEVLSHSETDGISDPAFETVPDAIIAAQSTEVDAAAGATVSSNAIMAAVEDALSKVNG